MAVRRLGVVSAVLALMGSIGATAGGLEATARPKVRKAEASHGYMTVEKGVRVWRLPGASIAYGGGSGYGAARGGYAGGETYDEPRQADYGNALYGTSGGYFGYFPGSNSTKGQRRIRTAAAGYYAGHGVRGISRNGQIAFASAGAPGYRQSGGVKSIEHGVRVQRGYGAPIGVMRGASTGGYGGAGGGFAGHGSGGAHVVIGAHGIQIGGAAVHGGTVHGGGMGLGLGGASVRSGGGGKSLPGHGAPMGPGRGGSGGPGGIVPQVGGHAIGAGSHGGMIGGGHGGRR